ncbi:MAG: delta(1)-pyrroline-2-carboxylate reductase family protein, partial [Massilia sp.]|nr:delta(1)-pyrroline-2-carboxylate reductase family protein [Massilia sp.]
MEPTLNAGESAALLPFDALVAALRLALVELEAGAIACPERQVVPLAGGARLLSMVATAADIAVHKLIAVAPGNPARGLPTILGQLSALDAATGERLIGLDGATVTGRRTAAMSMLGVATLLGRAPRKVLLIGAGSQAQHHADALAALYPQADVRVAGRGSVGEFCERNRLRAANGIDEDTDLVLTCTTSRTPVYREAARAGRLLIALGAFTLDAAEIAPATVRASTVFVDDALGARHEAGDLLQAGLDMAAVPSLARALGQGPLAEQVPVLFKTVGCAA